MHTSRACHTRARFYIYTCTRVHVHTRTCIYIVLFYNVQQKKIVSRFPTLNHDSPSIVGAVRCIYSHGTFRRYCRNDFAPNETFCSPVVSVILVKTNSTFLWDLTLFHFSIKQPQSWRPRSWAISINYIYSMYVRLCGYWMQYVCIFYVMYV